MSTEVQAPRPDRCHLCAIRARFRLRAVPNEDLQAPDLAVYFSCPDHFDPVWEEMMQRYGTHRARIYVDKVDGSGA